MLFNFQVLSKKMSQRKWHKVMTVKRDNNTKASSPCELPALCCHYVYGLNWPSQWPHPRWSTLTLRLRTWPQLRFSMLTSSKLSRMRWDFLRRPLSLWDIWVDPQVSLWTWSSEPYSSVIYWMLTVEKVMCIQCNEIILNGKHAFFGLR